MGEHSRLYPVLRYRQPKAAIDFLVAAFGFGVHGIHHAEDGSIVHAELKFGDSMIMLAGLDPAFAAQGRTISGGTSSVYVVVPYVDGHHDKAVAAGATISRPLADTSYGSREYSCRDTEGYEWHFGSYDPLRSPEE